MEKIRFTAFYVLFLVFGAMMVLGFAPYYFYWLPFISLAFLYFGLSRTKNVKQSFFCGLLFGFGLFGVGVAWLYHSLSTYGAMPDFMSIPAVGLFCLAMALYYGIAAALFRYFSTRNFQKFLVFPLIFSFVDYLRNIIFTGFPFLTLGYTQSFPSVLNSFSPLLGVFGLSFLLLLISSLLVFSLQNFIIYKNYKRAILALLFIIANFVTAYILEKNVSWSHPLKSEFTANLVQTNVLPNEKFSEKFNKDFFIWFYDFLRNTENSADAIILPETAALSTPETMSELFGEEIKNLARQQKFQNIIFGALGESENLNGNGFYNSAANIAMVDENLLLQQYHKRHLVPFGEYIPYGFGWFIEKANIPLSDFTKGEDKQDFFVLQNRQGDKILAALNICYEDAFGYELRKISDEVGVLINLSNMAWFGNSLAMWQHLQMAQMRSAELARPMLRATNTGITALISPKGEVIKQLPPFSENILKVKFFAYQGETPYLKYGDKIFYAMLLVNIFALFICKIVSNRNIKRRIF